MPRSLPRTALFLICLLGSSPSAGAAELQFQALSAGQLSANVAGRALNFPAIPDHQADVRMIPGIVVTNDIKDASSLGQAATSIAVHAVLKLQTRGL